MIDQSSKIPPSQRLMKRKGLKYKKNRVYKIMQSIQQKMNLYLYQGQDPLDNNFFYWKNDVIKLLKSSMKKQSFKQINQNMIQDLRQIRYLLSQIQRSQKRLEKLQKQQYKLTNIQKLDIKLQFTKAKIDAQTQMQHKMNFFVEKYRQTLSFEENLNQRKIAPYNRRFFQSELGENSESGESQNPLIILQENIEEKSLEEPQNVVIFPQIIREEGNQAILVNFDRIHQEGKSEVEKQMKNLKLQNMYEDNQNIRQSQSQFQINIKYDQKNDSPSEID